MFVEAGNGCALVAASPISIRSRPVRQSVCRVSGRFISYEYYGYMISENYE